MSGLREMSCEENGCDAQALLFLPVPVASVSPLPLSGSLTRARLLKGVALLTAVALACGCVLAAAGIMALRSTPLGVTEAPAAASVGSNLAAKRLYGEEGSYQHRQHHYSCEDEVHNWRSAWSDNQKEYCCMTQGLGCGESYAVSEGESDAVGKGESDAVSEGEFNCHVGLNNAAKGWSTKKKRLCCFTDHEHLGCGSFPIWYYLLIFLIILLCCCLPCIWCYKNDIACCPDVKTTKTHEQLQNLCCPPATKEEAPPKPAEDKKSGCRTCTSAA